MTKSELRNDYMAKRKSLTGGDHIEFNSRIHHHFFTHISLTSVKVLHTFLPIVAKREVDTWSILDEMKRLFPKVKLSIPKIDNQKSAIENFYYEGPDQLKENSWGVKEPTGGAKTNPTDIDMVLVPLLAFDTKGNRVGYGKGHYDKFLALCRTDCKKIGLSYFSPVRKIETGPYDLKLDCCITPEKIYSFD